MNPNHRSWLLTLLQQMISNVLLCLVALGSTPDERLVDDVFNTWRARMEDNPVVRVDFHLSTQKLPEDGDSHSELTEENHYEVTFSGLDMRVNIEGDRYVGFSDTPTPTQYFSTWNGEQSRTLYIKPDRKVGFALAATHHQDIDNWMIFPVVLFYRPFHGGPLAIDDSHWSLVSDKVELDGSKCLLLSNTIDDEITYLMWVAIEQEFAPIRLATVYGPKTTSKLDIKYRLHCGAWEPSSWRVMRSQPEEDAGIYDTHTVSHLTISKERPKAGFFYQQFPEGTELLKDGKTTWRVTDGELEFVRARGQTVSPRLGRRTTLVRLLPFVVLVCTIVAVLSFTRRLRSNGGKKDATT